MIDERDFDLFLQAVQNLGHAVDLAYISPQYGDAEIKIYRNGHGDPNEWEWNIKDLARDFFQDIDVTMVTDRYMTAIIYG